MPLIDHTTAEIDVNELLIFHLSDPFTSKLYSLNYSKAFACVVALQVGHAGGDN